jgi:cysteine-rich repeat protein
VAECGNGVLEPGEQCDDANTDDRDGCEHDCTLACGSATGADRAWLDPASGRCLAGFTSLASATDAGAACAALGGYLASLLDDVETMVAATLMSDSPSFTIGLDDVDAEGSFAWQSGDALADPRWCTGEPSGGADDDCVVLRTDMLCWQNVPCDDLFPYVCELP